MKGIVRRGDALVRPWRNRVHLRRALHGQRLMRTLAIELLQEAVELGLLLQDVAAAGRVASFFKVRCLRSIEMPSRSHHTASLERLNNPLGEAKGTPRSERMVRAAAMCRSIDCALVCEFVTS